jgi:hypothetical protein
MTGFRSPPSPDQKNTLYPLAGNNHPKEMVLVGIKFCPTGRLFEDFLGKFVLLDPAFEEFNHVWAYLQDLPVCRYCFFGLP